MAYKTVVKTLAPEIRSQPNTVVYRAGTKRYSFFRNRGTDAALEDLYLVSAFDMGMETTPPNNLFIAVRNNRDIALILKVVAKKVVDFSQINQVDVVYEGNTYSSPINQAAVRVAGEGASGESAAGELEERYWWWESLQDRAALYGSLNDSDGAGAMIRFPGSQKNWRTVYMYKLEPLSVADGLPEFAEWALEPLRYPQFFFRRRGSKIRLKDLTALSKMRVTSALPTLKPGQRYADVARYGVSLAPISGALNANYIASVFAAKEVEQRVAIEAAEGTPLDGAVTIRELPDMISKLDRAKSLFADFAKYLRETGSPAKAADVDTLVGSINRTRAIRKDLEEALNWSVRTPPDRSTWHRLDTLLGNNADPWIAISEDGDASAELQATLTEAEKYVKTLLYGRERQDRPIESTPTGRLSGNIDSLYYLRYLYLNNRMNKSSGTLFKAARIQDSWDRLRTAQAAQENSAANLGQLLQTIPVARLEPMDVEDGRFYLSKLWDIVEESLEQCPTICRDLDIDVPESPFLELWLKDNEFDLLAYKTRDTLPQYVIDKLKLAHKAYSEIVDDPAIEQSLRELRYRLTEKYPEFLISDTEYADSLDWANGARYGSLKLLTDINGEPVPNPSAHSYLYDALFIPDDESFIRYSTTAKQYEVAYKDQRGATQTAKVTLKKPIGIRGIGGGDPELWLTCDDIDDAGNPIIIYLGRASEVRVSFDFIEDDIDISAIAQNAMTPEDFACIRGEGVSIEDEMARVNAPPLLQLTAKEIAQYIVNQANEFGNAPNKYWMETLERKIGDQIVTVAGRTRMSAGLFDASMAQALVKQKEGNPAATSDPIFDNMGKPVIKSYVNFVRKVLIDISSIKWVRNGTPLDILYAKQRIPFMKTNVRLVSTYS